MEHPLLERDSIVPAFNLPGPDGMPHGPWDYKQRENLVLLFPPSTTTSDGRGILRDFAQHFKEFRAEYCAILAITANTVFANLEIQNALQLPFPLLADPKGTVIARYTAWDGASQEAEPCIVLTNRYNAVYEQWHAKQTSDLPSIEKLLYALDHMNNRCTP